VRRRYEVAIDYDRRILHPGCTKKTKRHGPGRTWATGVGTLVGVRCDQEFLGRLDQWRALQTYKPTRPKAILWLAEMGLARLLGDTSIRGPN
jgi:hypothetical protein